MPQHPLTTGDTTFFRQAFLRNAPRRYTVTLTPSEAQRLDQKYDERRGPITEIMLARHLAGEIALIVPAAVDGQAHLLAIDIDAGGMAGGSLFRAGRELARPDRKLQLWMPD